MLIIKIIPMNEYYEIFLKIYPNETLINYVTWIHRMHSDYRKENNLPDNYRIEKKEMLKYLNKFF